MADALGDIRRLLLSFEVLEDGPRVTEALASLCREAPVAGKQVHDANRLGQTAEPDPRMERLGKS